MLPELCLFSKRIDEQIVSFGRVCSLYVFLPSFSTNSAQLVGIFSFSFLSFPFACKQAFKIVVFSLSFRIFASGPRFLVFRSSVETINQVY